MAIPTRLLPVCLSHDPCSYGSDTQLTCACTAHSDSGRRRRWPGSDGTGLHALPTASERRRATLPLHLNLLTEKSAIATPGALAAPQRLFASSLFVYIICILIRSIVSHDKVCDSYAWRPGGATELTRELLFGLQYLHASSLDRFLRQGLR